MSDPMDQAGMMLLGEMKGQLREVIHTMNNMSSKIDALAEKVAVASNLPARVEDHEMRIKALEADKQRRDGAMGFGGWLLKSPLLGWLGMVGVTIWALLKEKL